MIERLKYVMVMLLLIVLGRGVAFAQFNPTNPPDPDMPVVYRNISVSATPNGAANVSGAGKYAEGKSVRIRTSANTSYKFQYWTKNGEKYSESTSFYYTVGKEDVNFVAVYKFDPANPQDPETDKRYELYLSSSPEGCCSFNRTSGEKIEAGQSVYVNVYSNQGFQFLGWYNGETLVSSSKSFYFTMPEKRTTLVAKFVYNPTLPEDPSNDGDQSDIDPGTPGAVTGISLDKTLLYLPVGDSYTLNATVSPDDATDKTVTWSTSDVSVATVANGVVKGIKEGKAVITAKAGSKTVTCDVHVIIPVTSVTLDKTSYDLPLGESFTLTASVLPDNATDKTVTWSSSNTSVAKVENGVVTSCGLGEAIITAKSGDKTASCNVRVIIPVSSVTLSQSTADMLVGESLALKAEVAPSNATDKTVAWSTSDATIATVDNNGVVNAVKVGKVTITAKAGDKTAICEVTVKPVLVSGISLDKISVELLEGETITLKATVSPDNATDKTITWSTSDATIATVDNNGVVKAIKVGKVTITAKAGDKTATCEVTVKPVPVSGIVLDKTSADMIIGESLTLKATVNPANATDKTVTWSTSDASIATVDNNGVVKAIKVGKVTITAKAGDKTATCEVTVKPVLVSGITLDKSNVELLEGETTTLKATVDPSNATDKTVTWSTSDATIATVDDNGFVKAIKVGKVTITANAGDKTATCDVTVKPVLVSGLSLDKTSVELLEGGTITLKATVEPSNATDKTVAWSTSDASIATVDNNGVVNAIKVGKVTITAKAGDKTATCEVTVKPVLVSEISIDKTSVELLEGETTALKATVSPDNATDKTVVWSTSDASIATVDNNGVVKAIKVGKVTITAKAGDKTATCEVTVKPVPVSGIVLDKTTIELLEGETTTLKATVSPDNATDKTVTWSTSDASIATVDNNGVVKAIKVGKVTITAKAGDKAATCEVTVKPVPVSGIVLDKTTIELLEGETTTLKATVSPDNATDKTVTWSTSDASIATVDNNGVVKAIKVGKVTITAKAGDKTATCEVTVKPVPVSGIVLDKTTVELLEGETITLEATVSPDNATDKTVTWSTSDASIATVDNNGVIKAIKVGKVKITAKAGDKTATCDVTVKPVLVSGISLDKTSVELLEGETTTLKATVEPSNATDKTVTWSTSDATIATVDDNGFVKAIKVGKVTITAKAGDKTATCEVTVKPVLVSGITLDKTSVELLEGGTITLKATVEPSNATDKTVAWSTSDASIATVDNNGVVKAIKVGKVTITAKAGDKTATCEVTVKPVLVSGIVLDKISVELFEGETITLTATVSPDNATDKTVTWSTSDASIATVDNNGVVKAIKVGKVTITAKAGDKTATCEVTVKPVLVSGITLDKTNVELFEGETTTLKATIEPSNATDKTVAWSTSDASIATVDNNGVIKAIKVGKVIITAKAGDKTATCEVTVKPVLVSGITLDKSNVELLEGETTTLKATVEPSNATDKTVTWSTSDASIATVDNNGVVKAIKVGKVTITAKAGDKTATCEVTVKPVLVSGIVLDKTTIELLEGETTTLKATVSPDNATDKTVTWSTSDASIATVDNNGVVKAIKVGKVTITAKAGEKTATCEVTVIPVPVSGIVLDKISVELFEGETITLTATVSPDNATDKTVTWSTSDATIATVDNNGVVKAIKVGKVTITAKAGDKTATCEVTVKPVPVSGIVLDKTTIELFEGETTTLKATVSPDNATDKTVTWSTSDASIATVDNNGVVKAIKVGKVTITAKAGDKTATCEVTVKPVPVSGIVLDKTEVELLEGDSITLTATVSPDNATDKTVTWSTSDATIATVDNNGVVKAIKVGVVTITAKAGDKTATCELTVKPNDVGIDDVNVTVNVLNGDIYTIRGIKVRNAGESLEGLAKGVYIKNGKKFLVK